MRPLYITLLDTVLDRAPTCLNVTLVEGLAETAVTFDVDGTEIATLTTDSQGGLAPTSLNLPEELGAAGTHLLTAVQAGAIDGTAQFTVLREPAAPSTVVGVDAQAVTIPGSVLPDGRRRWVFQDLMPGGLGSWVMPANPIEMSSPYLERSYDVQLTTAGAMHVSEGARPTLEWTFSGFATDEVFAGKLLDYGALNRRFYVIDHRGRAFKVIFADVSLEPRLRRNVDGTFVDGHDYTVTALVLDQEWVTPA